MIPYFPNISSKNGFIDLPKVAVGGRNRFDGQGVNPLPQLVGEKRIDQAVPRQAGEAGERRADDAKAEMRLALRMCAGMAMMAGGIIKDFQ